MPVIQAIDDQAELGQVCVCQVSPACQVPGVQFCSDWVHKDVLAHCPLELMLRASTLQDPFERHLGPPYLSNVCVVGGGGERWPEPRP